MRFNFLATALVLVGAVAAQRPEDISICDYYTTQSVGSRLKPFNKHGIAQSRFLQVLITTALFGNYSQNDIMSGNTSVPGILAPGTYNGTKVNLLPYFNGDFVSTNRGGKPVSVNFIDGGGVDIYKISGAYPAKYWSSNQHVLVAHLYRYFGVLLGCSRVGSPLLLPYKGSGSQYNVHKFMDLSDAEVSYFIEQIALSAASFGVSASDLMIIGYKLKELFGYRCSPPTTVIPRQGPQLQSICTDSSCALAPNSTCDLYDQITKPEDSLCYCALKACRSKARRAGIPSCYIAYLTCKAAPQTTSGNVTVSMAGSGSKNGTGSGVAPNKTSNIPPPSSGSRIKANSTIAPTKPTAVTAGAATVGLSFGVIAGGLAVLFL